MVDFWNFLAYYSTELLLAPAHTSVLHNDDVMFPSNETTRRHSQEPHFPTELEKKCPFFFSFWIMEDMYLTQKQQQKRSVVSLMFIISGGFLSHPVANLVRAGSKLHNGGDMPRSFLEQGRRRLMCRPKSPKDCRSTGKVGKDTKLRWCDISGEHKGSMVYVTVSLLPALLSLLEGSFSYWVRLQLGAVLETLKGWKATTLHCNCDL